MKPLSMEQLDLLVKVQRTEIEAMEIRTRLDGVPRKIEVLEEETAAFEQILSEEQTALSGLKKKYRDLDDEIRSNNSKMDKNRDLLQTVKNNREYQALLKGIDELKEKNSGIEDRMLECLDGIEELESKLDGKKEEIARFREMKKGEKEQILQEADNDRKRLEEFDGRFQELFRQIEPGLLETYRKVRELKDGIGIVPVKDAICQGCDVSIPPQMYNELQRTDSLRYCPHCQRIIYWADYAKMMEDRSE